MRFLLLLMSDTPPYAAAVTRIEAVRRMAAYSRALQYAGVLLGLGRLHPRSICVRFCFGDGHARVVEADAAEPGQVLGGYWMIEVASLAEALEWARRCPAAPVDVIEVRQLREPADFPTDVGPDVTRHAGRG